MSCPKEQRLDATVGHTVILTIIAENNFPMNSIASIIEKLQQSLQKCKGDNQTETNDSLAKIEKISQVVQSQDIVGDCNGHTDSHISETDSCVSDDTDTVSVRSSALDKLVDAGETIASYGRSGSADSGIHQSPLNSPVVHQSVDFPNQEEDEQIPEELRLPR